MVNAFSFCIYGPEIPKYYGGLLENIRLIAQHYPGWVIFISAGVDVPAHFLATLRANPACVVQETGLAGQLNTLHRFFAIDVPGVDVVFFRDADSRIHWKDRWAIQDFLATGRIAHIIRDHAQHAGVILAGLWGLRKGAFPGTLRQAFQQWTPVHAGNGDPKDAMSFGMDQNFLRRVVYPAIRSRALVHYSHKMLFVGEYGTEFPFNWSEDVFCGKVELDVTPVSEAAPRELRRSALNFLPKR